MICSDNLAKRFWKFKKQEIRDERCGTLVVIHNIIQVKNIKELKMEGKQFLNSNDHSKWAVGASPSKPIVCIGDINRQVSRDGTMVWSRILAKIGI